MKLRLCPLCAKTFRVANYEYKEDRRMFCSMSCKSMTLRTLVECLWCDKTFIMLKSRLKNGRGKYCCVQCFREAWVAEIASVAGLTRWKRRRTGKSTFYNP